MSADALKLFVQEKDRTVFEMPVTSAVEVGRQRTDEAGPPAVHTAAGEPRPDPDLVAAEDRFRGGPAVKVGQKLSWRGANRPSERRSTSNWCFSWRVRMTRRSACWPN